MEVLTLVLKRNVDESNLFRYHPKCDRIELINLCFADDLVMFSYGNVSSVSVLMNALEEFKKVSGLVPSIAKSTVVFANVKLAVKDAILRSTPFEEGTLPVRYLGVPLITTRLHIKLMPCVS